MERACSVELVWGGSFEPLAEDIHERWRAQQLKEHKPGPSWEELDESRKESNRAQARAIAGKLHSIQCAVAPLQNSDVTKDFTFTEEELEKLSIDEHARWWHERLNAGWKLIPIPQTDDEDEVNRLLEEAKRRKESPYLIPWADLLELDAEMDRRFGERMAGIADSTGLPSGRSPRGSLPSACRCFVWTRLPVWPPTRHRRWASRRRGKQFRTLKFGRLNLRPSSSPASPIIRHRRGHACLSDPGLSPTRSTSGERAESCSAMMRCTFSPPSGLMKVFWAVFPHDFEAPSYKIVAG